MTDGDAAGNAAGKAGAVAISQAVIVAKASAWLAPHMSSPGCKPIHVAGRLGIPNSLHAWVILKCGQRTPAGLPCGSAGSDGDIDGAMQHAPHSARQTTSERPGTNHFTQHIYASRQTGHTILWPRAGIGTFHALTSCRFDAQCTFAIVFGGTGCAHYAGASPSRDTPGIGGVGCSKTFFRGWAIVVGEALDARGINYYAGCIQRTSVDGFTRIDFWRRIATARGGDNCTNHRGNRR